MPASLPDAVTSVGDDRSTAIDRYRAVRRQTVDLVEPLGPEDCLLQSAPFSSPAKWHLAHTTWFFEQFVLADRVGYVPFDPFFSALFNSYYHSLGAPFNQARVGMLSRPDLAAIRGYRDHVDERVCRILEDGASAETWRLIELGINHEQQHQELILTDAKHAFHANPLQPPVIEGCVSVDTSRLLPMHWVTFVAGMREVGADDRHFAFDNERPRHRLISTNFELASRVITNGEYAEFMRAGGYGRAEL